MSIKFEIPARLIPKIERWVKEQNTKVAARQGNPYPNYGSCGGAYSYNFIPTSIGLVMTVSNSVTNEKIDITDYDEF